MSVKIFKTSLFLMLVAPVFVFAGIIDEIPKADLSRLLQGELLEYSQLEGNTKYPKTVLYQMVQASPEELAAVSFDYELQPSYFTKLTQAKIAQWISASEVLVDYIIKLSTFLPAVSFQSQNRIYKTGTRSFQNDSDLVESGAIQSSQIRFRVEPFNSSGSQSLLTVSSWIEPVLPVSQSLLRNGAVEMFSGLIQQVSYEKQNQPETLKAQMERLKQAVQ